MQHGVVFFELPPPLLRAQPKPRRDRLWGWRLYKGAGRRIPGAASGATSALGRRGRARAGIRAARAEYPSPRAQVLGRPVKLASTPTSFGRVSLLLRLLHHLRLPAHAGCTPAHARANSTSFVRVTDDARRRPAAAGRGQPRLARQATTPLPRVLPSSPACLIAFPPFIPPASPEI